MTPKQRKFCELYFVLANSHEAARQAGYEDFARSAADNLKNDSCIKYIDELNSEIRTPLIASAYERQKFWSETMRDSGEKMTERLKASELLGKAQLDFKERVELSGDSNLTVVIKRYGTDATE